MKVVGIDLAGSERNPTGFCLLVADEDKRVKTALLKTDDEIKIQCDILKPDVIAIDAPLSMANNRYMRKADEELQQYGALPHSLRGMTVLVERGVKLGQALKGRYKVVEVFNTATAKILGFYDKKDIQLQKNLLNLGIEGNLKDRILSRDELDSISAALTGYLYLQGKAVEVGDDEGKIVIPRV
jgi:predicted nuclease with RNAse H fold